MVSPGVLEKVGRLIWWHDLSLRAARNINSNYGWPIEGFPKKIKLSEEELLTAFNDYGKDCRDPKLFILGFKDSIRNNAIFMMLAFLLAIYSFDGTVPTKEVNENIFGCFLALAGLYFLWKLYSLFKARKQLTKN